MSRSLDNSICNPFARPVLTVNPVVSNEPDYEDKWADLYEDEEPQEDTEAKS